MMNNDLNTEQQSAVKATDGYVRVIAGPGTGKTRVLTSRLCHLIKKCRVDPNRILSVTFTNKATNEIKKRAEAMLGEYLETNISTFHGFCYRVLRTDIHLLGYPKQFLIMDREYQMKVLREIYLETQIPINKYPVAELLKYISDAKHGNDYVTMLIDPLSTSSLTGKIMGNDNILNELCEKYLKKQKQNLALDFDDLLHFTISLFNRNKLILTYWQDRFEYIQVDEFQDVNQAQFDLLNLLQAKHRNLFVVGDPDQTIYSFRGANIDFINNFETYFPGTETILLDKNYRSTIAIVNLANSLIKNNKNRIDNILVPALVSEGKVLHCHCRNIYDEATFIAEAILEIKKNQDAKFRDIAILYRANYLSKAIEEKLIKARIPYTVVKGIAFYNRTEIKDALAFLSLLVYEDDISFLRIINKPARHMGKSRIRFLKQYASQHNVSLLQSLVNCREEPLFQHKKIQHFIGVFQEIKSRIQILTTTKVLEEVLLKTGYENFLLFDENSDRIDNLRELKRSLAQYEKDEGGRVSISEYLSEIALYSELVEQQQDNSVKLMTVHSAKGLEFPYVIVCGMNDEIFPSSKISSEEEMEEERRLAYVAFTRAQRGLLLTSSAYGYGKKILWPSRFLSECEEDNRIVELKMAKRNYKKRRR
jgi:ATP-dependent DNA helicase UvrD/PcrA